MYNLDDYESESNFKTINAINIFFFIKEINLKN